MRNEIHSVSQMRPGGTGYTVLFNEQRRYMKIHNQLHALGE